MVRMRTYKALQEKIEAVGKANSNGYNVSYLNELDKLMILFENLEYTVRTRLEPLESVNPDVNDPITRGKIDALKWFLNRED